LCLLKENEHGILSPRIDASKRARIDTRRLLARPALVFHIGTTRWYPQYPLQHGVVTCLSPLRVAPMQCRSDREVRDIPRHWVKSLAVTRTGIPTAFERQHRKRW
jgi:hypothetical protein